MIIATGARAREIPPLPIDGKKILSYKEAMLQKDQPKRMVVVGAGAIGVEFAYFYHNMGTEVTIVEVMDRLVPVEDADCSKELGRAFRKMGIKVMTDAQVQSVDTKGKVLKVKVKTKKGEEILETDQVLSAVGVQGNVEELNLDKIGVKVERGSIKVDGFGRTGVEGVYAIGDVAGAPGSLTKPPTKASIASRPLPARATTSSPSTTSLAAPTASRRLPPWVLPRPKPRKPATTSKSANSPSARPARHPPPATTRALSR